MQLSANAPTGECTLYVGMYEYPSLQRLPAFIADARVASDAILVLTVRIK